MFRVNLRPKWVNITNDVTYRIAYVDEGRSYFVLDEGEICLRKSYGIQSYTDYTKKDDMQLSVALCKAILTVIGYNETLSKPLFNSLSMALHFYLSSSMLSIDNETSLSNIKNSFMEYLIDDMKFDDISTRLLVSNYHYIVMGFKKQYNELKYTSPYYELMKKGGYKIEHEDVIKHIQDPLPSYEYLESLYHEKLRKQQAPIDK